MMKLFFDFFPIVLFFIAYKFAGIYIATLIAISTALLQMIYTAVVYKRCETLQWVSLLVLVFLGGATLWFHNELFIKLKPTIINMIFGLGFLASQFLGQKKPLIQRFMQEKIDLPTNVWMKLNYSWAMFFFSMAMTNLYVMQHYDTNTWVNFKLFGMLGLTLLFTLVQAIYLSKHLKTLKN